MRLVWRTQVRLRFLPNRWGLGLVNPKDLPQTWREQADGYERDGVLVRADVLVRRMAAELEAALDSYENKALRLSEAASESGYSEDGLARLVRERKIPNAGRQHAPRIRRCDLPRKPDGDVAVVAQSLDLKEQIARSIVNTGNGGHDD